MAGLLFDENLHDDDDDDLSFKLALVGFRWTPFHSVGVDHPVEVRPACVDDDDDDGDDDGEIDEMMVA